MTTFKKLTLPTLTIPYALGANDTTLQLEHTDSNTYAGSLLIGEHTWATVSNGVATEVIKLGVRDYLNNIPILERGATPLAFSEGACVTFGWTDEAIAEMYPESGLDFIDGCGAVTKCACDIVPAELTMGQPMNIIIPFIGAPASAGRSVTMDIAGLSHSSTASSVLVSGTPTVAGTYVISVKITKGGLSRSMTCNIRVVDPTAAGSGSC